MTIDETIEDATTQATLEDSAARWDVPTPTTTVFDWDYTGGRDNLLRLYDKGTRNQWVGSDHVVRERHRRTELIDCAGERDGIVGDNPAEPVPVSNAGLRFQDDRKTKGRTGALLRHAIDDGHRAGDVDAGIAALFREASLVEEGIDRVFRRNDCADPQGCQSLTVAGRP